MSRVAPWIKREAAEVLRTIRALARAALHRASLSLLAVLIAFAGAGFLLSTCYLILMRHLGDEYAGLILGTALLVCAAFVFVYARWKHPRHEPANVSPDQLAGSAAENELAPMSAFVAAFVLARQLRRRQTR